MGGGVSAGRKTERDAGRYTVVLTNLPGGERKYLVMSEDGRHEVHDGTPPTERLRGEIRFEELPVGTREKASEIYRGLWGL